MRICIRTALPEKYSPMVGITSVRALRERKAASGLSAWEVMTMKLLELMSCADRE